MLRLTNFPKEDCFAYLNSAYNGCNALVTLECKYGNKPCPFYKPKSEMKNYKVNDERKVRKRGCAELF